MYLEKWVSLAYRIATNYFVKGYEPSALHSSLRDLRYARLLRSLGKVRTGLSGSWP